MKFSGAQIPYEMLIWELAERFHWTLEYAENLSMKRLAEWEQIKDGRRHAERSIL